MTAEEHKSLPLVLAIGGIDPTGAAGLAADVRAGEAAGVHVATVASALTVQNARGVQWTEPVAALLLREQIRAVLEEAPVAAVKIGLLPTAEVAEVVEEALSPLPRKVPMVIDPVLGASAGGRLVPALSRSWRKAMRRLARRATLLTPNLMEAAALLSELPVQGRRLMRAQAQALVERYGCAVLMKGGHLRDGDTVVDLLLMKDGAEQPFVAPRVPTQARATGCTLATRIAAGLAQGKGLMAAVSEARAHLLQGLRQHVARGWSERMPARLPVRLQAVPGAKDMTDANDKKEDEA